MFLGSLSRHNKDLEQRTLSPWSITALGSWTNCVTALKQISVTAPFYLEDSRRVRERKRKRERERERARASERKHTGERVPEKALWLLLLYVFFLHLGLLGIFSNFPISEIKTVDNLFATDY